MSEATKLHWKKEEIAFLICGFGSLIFFIAGIAFSLPYILSFAWIHNPEAIAPLPYWYAIPCFVISFVLFEVTLKLDEIPMKNCNECYMDGNCIYQANNDMCPLGVNPRKKKKGAK